MSRQYKIDTLLNRINGLYRKGFITENNKPLWLDVCERFPPKIQLYYGKTAENIKVKEIFYPEDVARAKLHNSLSNMFGLFRLDSNNTQSRDTKFIGLYQKYISNGLSEDAVMERIKIDYKPIKSE